MMTTPPGSWPSPISAEQAVAAGRGLEAVAFAGEQVWWSEGRPTENGRIVVCHNPSGSLAGSVVDLLPPPWNARTRVHEYGGTSWIPVPSATGHDLVFANFDDQRLYRSAVGSGAQASPQQSAPQPLTPTPSIAAGLRYADFHLDSRRQRLIAVRETHHGDGTHGTVDRTVVAIPLDGSAAEDPTAIVDLLVDVPRSDFLACPRMSPAGDAMGWISWNHPDMPWDSTSVHWAPLDRSGKIGSPRLIAGGEGISAVDAGFLSDGSVLVMSDESGWWQPTVIDPRGPHRRVLSHAQQEFTRPMWVLGRRSWASVPGGRLLVSPNGRPAVLDTLDGQCRELDPQWTATSDLAATPEGRLALVVGGDRISSRIVVIEPTGHAVILRNSSDNELPVAFVPQPVERVLDGIHAVVYPPTHPDHVAEPGAAPLIITVHGGPTAQHPRNLSSHTAFFTSRGFAVAAVDYRGSTGYGRPYRDALRGRWADLDIADAMTVARALCADGTAGHAFISGGSAGGLTVLGALTTPGHPFAGGTSSYGIGDLEVLDADTHDFESRYMERLLGSDKGVWRERSPLTHADKMAVPVLLLQGGKDPVVTPNQAEAFAAACRRNGVAHALVIFPDESHGFRAAAARITALEKEIAFYGQVLDQEIPGIPPVVLTK